MHLSSPTPILRILDEDGAKRFYVEILGFVVDWEHRFDAGMPLYAQISRNGCILHLTEHELDAVPGGAVRIGVGDIDAFRDEVSSRAINTFHVEDTDWDTREMSIQDPFGNRLTFYDDS
jgi:catechol 2,3-dioxygenase-like lactoylglutathione lyase family enzyme